MLSSILTEILPVFFFVFTLLGHNLLVPELKTRGHLVDGGFLPRRVLARCDQLLVENVQGERAEISE